MLENFLHFEGPSHFKISIAKVCYEVLPQLLLVRTFFFEAKMVLSHHGKTFDASNLVTIIFLPDPVIDLHTLLFNQ